MGPWSQSIQHSSLETETAASWTYFTAAGRRGDGAGDERTAERATSGQSPSQIFFFFFFLRGTAPCFDRITRAPLIARQSCDSHQSAVCRFFGRRAVKTSAKSQKPKVNN